MIRPISKEKNALIEILRDNSATNLTCRYFKNIRKATKI